MSIKNYPKEESLERIYRSLRGDTLNQEEGSLTGSQYSSDEALSRIAQLMQGQIPGESGALPSGISADGLGLGNYGLVVDGIGTKETIMLLLGRRLKMLPLGKRFLLQVTLPKQLLKLSMFLEGLGFLAQKNITV